ncbi:MAG TPA: hypothetical protein P5540_07910 [Candidatus Hydrogenedentes bacterium]|nr:hypothetical protein [Candidatus Hydrogenedentota bacterium]
MRKEKALIKLLCGLVEVIADEASRNPDFEAKIEGLLCNLPERKVVSGRKCSKKQDHAQLPDIYAEWKSRSETDFRLWLREQSVTDLHALIRTQDLDSTRRTSKWKEPEKLAEYITDCLRSRLSRGSAFIGRESIE